ncbi:general stress protein 26 [Dyadobacter jejuensis]|uniref:General stress protein 26 n=1 Tax=Dyadobacter jejuensis TaxID=1082580 RepID=A0A316A9T5_9BACT|nr:pyridoxamine 5'-phosphate oxidase family protein [Dyadobacter jejuensis]PWJ54272.1 general stress protein 26 [Dyadobacter jejuensis]
METNLIDRQGIEKLKELASEIKICMFTTLEKGKIVSRPMTALETDDDGNIWFFTSKDTDIGSQMREEEVTLLFASPEENSYLSVSGSYHQVQDEEKKKSLWNPISKAWFPAGKEDPSLVMIRVCPQEASYWDSSSSKMVVFLSLLKSMVTGKQPAEGEHGTIELH